MPERVRPWRPLRPVRRVEARPTAAARGYCSAAWRRLRKRVIARDGGICQLCGQPIVGEPGDVDHIVPKPLGTDALDNLRLLHHACHSRRTALDAR